MKKIARIVFLVFFLSSLCACCAHAQQTSKEEESLYVAQKAFEDGFYDVSLGLLERFLQNYPNSLKKSQADLLMGQCYYQQGKYLEALRTFESIMNQSPAKDIQDALYFWIGEVHFKGNNLEKSAQYYQLIIKEFPNSKYIPAAYYSLGWSLFQQQAYAAALTAFKTVEEKYLRQDSQFQDAPFKIIECLYNLKDYGVLQGQAAQYIKEYSKSPDRLGYLYFYQAEAEYYLDNFDGAVQAYTHALDYSKDNRVRALSGLGLAWSLVKAKRYAEAENAFLSVKTDDLDVQNKNALVLGRASLMVETNRANEAQKLYDELAKAADNPLVLAQALLGKADALYNLASYDEAVNAYRKGLQVSVADSVPKEITDKLHYGLSWALLKQGGFKEAIAEFQKVAKTTEDKIIKVSALCQIGDAYQDAGDYALAQEAYDTVLRDYPDSFYGDYVQYQLGLTLLKAGNNDGAILSFNTFQRNYPQSKLSDDVAYSLGLAYFQKQDYRMSKEAFEKFQNGFPDSDLRPQALYLLGTSLYNTGDFTAAIEAFKNISRLYGQDRELVQKAEYEIADCYYQMGDEAEAMKRFEALRSKYPDSSLTAEIIWWLGEYYYRRGDLALARRYFLSLVQDYSKSSLVGDAYYAVGSICQQEDKLEEAVDYFKKVIALGRKEISAQAVIAIADIYAKQNKPAAAKQAYEGVLKEYPNLNHLIYPKMGDLFFLLNDYSQALEYYRKSLEVVPLKEAAPVQFRVAETLEALQKVDEAVSEYLNVVYLFPEDQGVVVKSLLRAAKIYEDKENFKEALRLYKKVIATGALEQKYAQERVDWITKNIK